MIIQIIRLKALSRQKPKRLIGRNKEKKKGLKWIENMYGQEAEIKKTNFHLTVKSLMILRFINRPSAPIKKQGLRQRQ